MKTYLLVVVGTLVAGAAQAASTWDGVYTDSQADRGRAQYLQHCSVCHSVSLQGNNESPPLVGRFMPDWADAPLIDLYDYVSTAMPLDRPGSLSATTAADIVAYLLKANGFPNGQRELEPDNLASIRFDLTRPSNSQRKDTRQH